MQNVSALFIKQWKDTLKNMPVLVLFLVYPCISLIMTQTVQKQVGEAGFFLSIFATMHCVFTPIETTANLLSEEKENNTLRVLIMSNVTLKEYFLSTGGFVLLADLISSTAFLFMSGYTASDTLTFLLIMGIGCMISTILGTCVGLYARNVAAANGLAVPLSMVFAFLPMLSKFNDNIKAVAKFTYSQQISCLISGEKLTVFGAAVIGLNAVIFLAVATVLYKRSLS
jgi:ABC-2 type transport system permease protein